MFSKDIMIHYMKKIRATIKPISLQLLNFSCNKKLYKFKDYVALQFFKGPLLGISVLANGNNDCHFKSHHDFSRKNWEAMHRACSDSGSLSVVESIRCVTLGLLLRCTFSNQRDSYALTCDLIRIHIQRC